MATCRLPHVFLLLSWAAWSRAQAISTSMSLPPLQWLNLSPLLQGPAPPPLIDASIGYDDTSRNLLIFGGQSADGLAQSSTYLLNLETLEWQTPNPPLNLAGSPPARSAAVSGDDFAASNRHAHVLIGGRNGNTALSDVWEFDYINQFWAEVNLSPGGPSPRWGASGGIDIQVAPISDPVIPGPNNTVYLAGGADENGPISISDFWQLSLSGTLSSNLPNSSSGSWHQITTGKSPALVSQAGTVVRQQVVAAGGCNTTSVTNDSCALQGSYVMNAGTDSTTAPSPCPAPRVGAALAQNFNAFSSSFSNQVFLLLGLFNESLWDDGGGLEAGEVAVLDINGGVWSRVLVSGDPGKTGQAAFPSPREGAAVLSYSQNLVGSSRSTASDTIIFGGRDASGNYLSEVWVLRAYNGAVSSSGQKWTGYGNGSLQTGVDSSGAGVTMKYITTCASAITSTSKPTSSSSSPSATSTHPAAKTTPTTGQRTSQYDVSTSHKVLAPVSVALLLPAVILSRMALPSSGLPQPRKNYLVFLYTAILTATAAFGLGVAGLALSFTSIVSGMSIQKRSSASLNLKTGHGKAGLVLFACLYGLVPILFFLRYGTKSDQLRSMHDVQDKAQHPRPRLSSMDTAEKLNSNIVSATHSAGNNTPRRRTSSWQGIWSGSRSRTSHDSESALSAATTPGAFEVVNRPQRVRRASRAPPAQNVGDMSWMDQRRSLNAVGELDYALSQAHQAQGQSTPVTPDIRSTLALMTPIAEPISPVEMPHPLDIVLHILFHLLLVAICALSLAALWSLKSRVGFIIFLVWISMFYVLLLALAWQGKPRRSVLTVILYRLRGSPSSTPPTASPPAQDQYPFPTDSFPAEVHSPYAHHQPPFRVTGIDDISTIHDSPRSMGDDDDDDEDDDARQQRMEEEMARRDVSIVTVPRRKLWITNPESV